MFIGHQTNTNAREHVYMSICAALKAHPMHFKCTTLQGKKGGGEWKSAAKRPVAWGCIEKLMNVTRRLTRTQANCLPCISYPSELLDDIQWNSRQIVKNYMFTLFATFCCS